MTRQEAKHIALDLARRWENVVRGCVYNIRIDGHKQTCDVLLTCSHKPAAGSVAWLNGHPWMVDWKEESNLGTRIGLVRYTHGIVVTA